MALVGDNGAGKSTLIKCIAGIYTADERRDPLRGRAGHDPRPEGLGAPRHRGRVPGSRALRQPRRRPEHVPRARGAQLFQLLKEPEMEARTRETMKGLSVTTIRSIRQLVATLSGGQRQSVAVARAVLWNSRLVILDEPTAALGVAQTQQVLDLVSAPRRSGARRRPDLAQPPRHLRRRRPHHRAPARPQHRRLRAQRDDAAGARPGDHGRRAHAGLRHPGNRNRGRSVSVRRHDPLVEAPPPLDPTGIASYPGRMMDNLRSGNLGSGPGHRRARC